MSKKINNIEEFTLCNFKIYYETLIIKTVILEKDEDIKWNIVGNLLIDIYEYS